MGDFDVTFLKRSRMRDMTEQNSPIQSDLLYPLVVGHLTFEKVTLPPRKKATSRMARCIKQYLWKIWVIFEYMSLTPKRYHHSDGNYQKSLAGFPCQNTRTFKVNKVKRNVGCSKLLEGSFGLFQF